MAKTALVTGASRGIGKAVAEQLEKRGCTVVRTSRRAEQNLDDGWLNLALDDGDSVNRAAEAFGRVHGKLDILINNAAVLLDSGLSLSELPDDTLLRTLEVNVLGVHRVTRAFLPYLRLASRSRIVNVSSRAGQLNDPMQVAPAYCVSKTALNGLTSQQALEYAKDGISVNALSPGWVKTDMGGREAPLTPEQGADTIVWLALDVAPEVTGRFWAERAEIPW